MKLFDKLRALLRRRPRHDFPHRGDHPCAPRPRFQQVKTTLFRGEPKVVNRDDGGWTREAFEQWREEVRQECNWPKKKQPPGKGVGGLM